MLLGCLFNSTLHNTLHKLLGAGVTLQIPFKSLRENKIKYFQFRFVQRMLGTNRLLFTYEVKLGGAFCKHQEDTLSRLFIYFYSILTNISLDAGQRVLGYQFFLPNGPISSIV